MLEREVSVSTFYFYYSPDEFYRVRKAAAQHLQESRTNTAWKLDRVWV